MGHLLRLLCVCALAGLPMTGCSDGGGAGGGGGSAGTGGGGTGGSGGGGTGGDGGSGGDPCADVDCNDLNPCTVDSCDPTDGSCVNEPREDGTSCMIGLDPGECVSGTCTALCDLVDCNDDNECTEDLCDPVDGSCTNPNRPDGATCDFGGMPGRCNAGACEDAALCAEVDCSDGNECTDDVCDPGDGSCSNAARPDGSGCDDGNGSCVGGACSVRKLITLGCTNNVNDNVSILEWELWVTREGDIVGGESFDATLDGIAFFSEEFLDAAQGAIPGGVEDAGLVAIAATVLPRSGATGDPVTLVDDSDAPFACAIGRTACDPANDDASIPGARANSDCTPSGVFNPCLQFTAIPTSSDCSECDALGDPKSMQCANNGFCVTGPLPVDLEAKTTTYTAASSGEVLLGWDDQNTGATENPDGTYELPPVAFIDPPTPNGVRVFAILQAAVQCTMAVDSGGPNGVGIPDQSSPSPDTALLSLPIE